MAGIYEPPGHQPKITIKTNKQNKQTSKQTKQTNIPEGPLIDFIKPNMSLALCLPQKTQMAGPH
jgi:hypothetical protein